jgi:tetratricopeptide (TPR) repeat protein
LPFGGEKRGAMRIRRGWLVLGGLIVCVAGEIAPGSRSPGDALADATLAAPPHFLTLADRQRVIFFVNEPITGPVSARVSDGAVEVSVPHAGVDPTLAVQSFHGDPGAGEIVSKLTVAAALGGAAIYLETQSPVAAAVARSVNYPPRIIVDLVTTASAADSTPRPSPPPTGAAKPSAKPRPTPRPRGTAVATPVPSPAAPPSPTALPSPAASPSSAASPSPKASPSPTASPSPAAPPATARPSPVPSVKPVAVSTSTPGARSGVSATPAPSAAPMVADPAPCRWVRLSGGFAFCRPNPDLAPYAAHQSVAVFARSLGEERAAPPGLPEGLSGAPLLFLGADLELVRGAARGRVLGAVDDYAHALRQYPSFPDVGRAQLNVALVYAALGFEPELEAAAKLAESGGHAAIALALLGDQAIRRGRLEAARDLFAQAQKAGGLGECLAARGRASIAVAARHPEAADAELGTLAAVCPKSLETDFDTRRVVARVKFAGGDARSAAAILAEIRSSAPPAERLAIVEELAIASEAAGDLPTARRCYEALAAAHPGTSLAARAKLGLARLDAASGNVEGAFGRLASLEPGEMQNERRAFALDAAARSLRGGTSSEAIALVQSHAVAPEMLSPDDQVLLARAYRETGLIDEGERVLAALAAKQGASAPDALWEERAQLALVRGDGQKAIATLDDQVRLRGAAPAAALALRARALVQQGQGADAVAPVVAELAKSDPAAARELRIELAQSLRRRDPASAAALARDALAMTGLAELSTPRAAAALRTLGEASEDSGDEAAAAEAFRRLVASYPSDPAAADASYRLGRLTRKNPGVAAPADSQVKGGDALAQRVSAAVAAYDGIVAPFGGDSAAAAPGAETKPQEVAR